MDKNELRRRIDELSPEKRALLERRLMEMGVLAPSEPGIPRRDGSGACALSYAQRRLWFLDQMEPNSCVYNITNAVRLRGVLEVGALREALNVIVGRHEALRSTFVVRGEEPVQVVAERWAVELPVVDLSAGAEGEREGEVERVLRAEARRPFDLGTDLMLRALLVRVGEQEHVLLLTMHHIASDGWSMGVLTRELTALYAAIAQGREPGLAPLPIQYGDYAVWQRGWLQGAELEKQLAYWTGELAGAPATLQLPTDRPRPAVQTYRGAREVALLSRGLSDALHALSQRERVTLFTTLLAAFTVLLHRHAGTEDVVVGTAIAGRRRVETEPLIGFFVNTLVLRVDLSGDLTFREFLGQVRERVLEAYDHQDLPFEKLVEELRPERSLSWTPLVQVLFVLQDGDQPTLEFPGLTASPVEVNKGTAKFDLSASVTETPRGLRVTLEYNTDLYDAGTIRRVLGHYETLLKGIVADPGQRVTRLPLLPEAERHQVLVEWNATQAPFPETACIHGLFEAQVERTPEAIAVIFADQSLTYRQLNQRANQLAHYLQKRGVGPDVLVGLCLERSLNMVVGLLGILKAGGAYVPLDPTDPKERLAFMLHDARVSVLVTEQRTLEGLPEPGVPAVCLDADWGVLAREGQDDPVSRATADHLSYVIYTSGSTGKPKGVMTTHRAVSNLVSWMQARFPMNGMDVVLQKTPYTFDASVVEFFPALLVGARLVMARPEGHRDGRYLIDTICAERVSRLKLVPSLMQAMIEEPGLEGCTSLRWVSCGGEALSRAVLERFRERLSVEFVNLYGPTEATVDATFWVSGQQGPPDVVPIGRPIANTQLYILDAHMQPVPVGVPGELYIGGVGLARGYLERPELTAERFLPNPFSAEAGALLYKTGDLGRYLADGNIEYLGRLDDQVKVRGFRIELGEVETALCEHPDVRESVVVVREDTPGEKRLVAYVVPRQGAALTIDSLRHVVQAKLPEYMVPSAFILLASVPLASSGKADRRSLPVPATMRSDLDYVAPQDAMERQIAQIWEETLGVHPVGVTDNFFELGGHSLLAVRIINAIEQTIGLRLPVSVLFEGATIRHLAQALQQKAGAMTRTLEEVRGLSAEAARRLLDGAGG